MASVCQTRPAPALCHGRERDPCPCVCNQGRAAPLPLILSSHAHTALLLAFCTPFLPWQGEADATWVFLGWEGVEAARAGVELNSFK